MSAIGLAILLAFGGTIVAALWTFVVGLAGAPGAMYAASALSKSEETRIPPGAFWLTLLGQLAAMLIFTVFVVESTRSLLAGAESFRWVAWAAAWWVSSAPGWMATKDSAQVENRTVQQVTTAFSAPLASLSFFLFTFLPESVNWGFGWVPHL